MKDTHDLRVSARTAYLLASDGEGDGPPWQFSGVAVTAGDILHMDDGTPVLFTEEELRSAAETQAGEPLTVDHPTDDDGRPQYPPPTDETIGKVPKAGWLDSVAGVGYEATTHDEEIATGVQAGSYDVSVHPAFTFGEKDPETGAYIAENVQFRDLSVVSKGDSPSNTAEWGANQALASLTASAIGDELPAGDDGDGPGSGVIRSAVRATLEAVGLEPGTIDEESIAQETMGAESPTGSDKNTMDDSTREEYLGFVTAHSSIGEDDVAEMSDGLLEQTHEIVAEAAADGGDGDSNSDADDDVDDPDDDDIGAGDDLEGAIQSLSERMENLEEKMITQDDVGDLADQVTAQATKSDQVDEIIATSDDYDEDDREDLMASAGKVVDREHERVTTATSSQLPGTAGLTASAGPELGEDVDDDLDEYDTGVAEH